MIDRLHIIALAFGVGLAAGLGGCLKTTAFTCTEREYFGPK